MNKTYWLVFALMMQLGFSQVEVEETEQIKQTEDKEEVDLQKPPNILLIDLFFFFYFYFNYYFYYY